jgi:hypothetical protein
MHYSRGIPTNMTEVLFLYIAAPIFFHPLSFCHFTTSITTVRLRSGKSSEASHEY